MLTDMAVIQRAVPNFVSIINGPINVVDRVPKLVPDPDLTFALFTLLDKVENQNGTGVALKQVGKMQLRGRVGGIYSIQLNRRLGHCHATFLRPKSWNGPAHLQVGRKGPRRRDGLVVQYLFVLHVVGDLSLLADATLEIARPRKVPRPTSQQHNVQAAAVVVHPALQKGTVNDGHDPVVARGGSQATLKIAREKPVPSVRFFERRGREGFGRGCQKILLQTAREIVGIRKVKVFGKVYHLKKTLVPQFGCTSRDG